MNFRNSRIGSIVLNIFVGLALLTALRLGFFVWNYEIYLRFGLKEIAAAFLHGLRFDLSLLLTILAPYFVLALIAPALIARNVVYRYLERILFLAPLVLAAGFCFVDYVYFPVAGGRLTLTGTAYQTDLFRQLWVLTQSYWGVPLAMAFVGVLLNYLFAQGTQSLSIKHFVLVVPVCVLGAIVGIRGGFQGKILHSAHAFEQGDADMGSLALNTPFHLIHSRKNKPVEKYSFFKTTNTLDVIPFKRPECRNCPKADTHENLIVIILESFASEYTAAGRGEKSLTPFLDELSSKSAFFENHYASGKTSIEAIPAILGGIPSLFSEAFIVSPYQSNRIEKLGSHFSKNGYWTGFFHSGKKGTMYFDVASRLVGIENYESFETYPNAELDYDGGWGIWDFKYYAYMVKKLSQLNKPFYATVFTLSSHDPYHIHPDYKDRFPKGELAIHESVGFADEALKQFFKEASKEPWFQKTLFVITADHTQGNSVPSFAHPLGRFRVPLLFYHPKKDLSRFVKKDKVSSHVDIVPTLKNYFGFGDSSERKLLFGQNLFDGTQNGYVVVGGPSAFWSIEDSGKSCRFLPQKNTFDCVDLEKNPYYLESLPRMSENESETEIITLQKYIQYFNEGAIENSWVRDFSD
jgi:phosphoglycerol transferase MdoB-like AlkP superfamily enzyme